MTPSTEEKFSFSTGRTLLRQPWVNLRRVVISSSPRQVPTLIVFHCSSLLFSDEIWQLKSHARDSCWRSEHFLSNPGQASAVGGSTPPNEFSSAAKPAPVLNLMRTARCRIINKLWWCLGKSLKHNRRHLIIHSRLHVCGVWLRRDEGAWTALSHRLIYDFLQGVDKHESSLRHSSHSRSRISSIFLRFSEIF